ncbi:Rpr2-domain-containing protein [Pseudovirgaria hyperparasitica]|uniref:Rpr2-domain-containing protein n=1 Tax=Pseudovirgaria hyperparasitica TaxID=470096 RepID=A0A6A6VRP9_9PEZI|nr:Rpr2-domain-containing protein [Pseudovirgaria hyperparasitica]KAF2753358.1 Rpr2-domain-containing protein [Pseudovirgaria hyperparasitica]
MARKTKGTKVPNRHVHSRISFLQQAGCHLAVRSAQLKSESKEESESCNINKSAESSVSTYSTRLSQRLMMDLKAVSQKTLVRLSKDLKRSICKRCDTLLIPGITSSSHIENKSRGGRKSKADVLVVRCRACTAEKRMPCGIEPQSKKREREQAKEAAQDEHHGEDQVMDRT